MRSPVAIVFVSASIILLLLPRLALLTNGLDAQRIWDTNTPDAFRFLAAVKTEKVGEFFLTDHKYPLLGSYLYLPVIGGYYLVNKSAGIFSSPADFIQAYALGETSLFFCLRLEALLLNLAAIALLIGIVRREFKEVRWAPLIMLVFLAADFTLAMFSVQPRIHSWAFAGTVLTWYLALRLLRKKSWFNYLMALGAAGLTISLAQSGVTTLALPVAAHFLGTEGGGRRRLFSGLGLAGLIALFIGYPHLLGNLAGAANPLLSGEHQRPGFGLAELWQFLRDFFVYQEMAAGLAVIAGVWAGWRARWRLRPLEVMASAHLLFWLLLFGFADVTTPRFALVILPSLLLLVVSFLIRLESKRFVWYGVCFLLLVQLYGVMQLARLAGAGDTREQAAVWLLSESQPDDMIVTTLDPDFLGIVPTGAAIALSGGPRGASEQLIFEKQLRGEKSRFIQYQPEGIEIAPGIDWIATSKPLSGEMFSTFSLVHTVTGNARGGEDYVAWDTVPAGRRPVALRLQRFRAFGPGIYIYRNNEIVK